MDRTRNFAERIFANFHPFQAPTDHCRDETNRNNNNNIPTIASLQCPRWSPSSFPFFRYINRDTLVSDQTTLIHHFHRGSLRAGHLIHNFPYRIGHEVNYLRQTSSILGGFFFFFSALAQTYQGLSGAFDYNMKITKPPIMYGATICYLYGGSIA